MRRISKARRNHHIIVGEWSLGLKVESIDRLSSDLGRDWVQSERKFALMQITYYDRCVGHFFWTWRKEGQQLDGWSFRKLMEYLKYR